VFFWKLNRNGEIFDCGASPRTRQGSNIGRTTHCPRHIRPRTGSDNQEGIISFYPYFVPDGTSDQCYTMPETRPTLWVRHAQIYLLDLPRSNPSRCPDLRHRSGQISNAFINKPNMKLYVVTYPAIQLLVLFCH